MELLLKFFAEDTHKSVTTQEQFNEFRNEFKPEFTEVPK
jgi:hypothetical protein